MSRAKLLPKIWQRPGVYLFDYAQGDGASMYTEFIHAVYRMSSGVTLPKRIRFESQGEYHHIMAQKLNIQLDSIGMNRVPSDALEQSSLIDWLLAQAVALVGSSLSYLGLRFTLHPTVFNSRRVTLKEVEQALKRLQRHVSKEFEVTAKKYNDDGFAMTIEPREKQFAETTMGDC